MFPNNIFQIYNDKKIVPEFVSEYIKNLNPNYNYYLYDFDEIKNDFVAINNNLATVNYNVKICFCFSVINIFASVFC